MLFRKTQPVSQNVASGVLDDGLKVLAQGRLFAVSLNENREFTENDGSAESLRNYLDKNASETESEQPRELFCVNVQGCHIYPVFTSSEQAQEWIKKKPFSWSGATAVTLLGFQAPKLFRRFAGAPPAVIIVVDPMSGNERVLAHGEVQSLARL